MSTEYDMEFDNLHALENFLDIYDSPGEAVVTEAIANSVDADSSRIDIKFGLDHNEKRIISFQDDGPGMNEKQFADYHIAAKQNKVKGEGIGFAGIGAKVYIGRDFQDAQIFTETCCGNNALASVMYKVGRKIKWKYLKSTHRERGTLYKVLLNNEDYDYLAGSLEQVIIRFFNNALVDGLKITINGKALKPWIPKIIKKKTGVVAVKNRKLPYTFILTGEEVPTDRRCIDFHVKGKTIKVREPGFHLDLKPEYQNKFYVSINSIEISDQLKTDKVSFKTGWIINSVYREIDKAIFKIVEDLGLLEKQAPQSYETNRFTKALEDLFNDPDLAWLNPDAAAMKTISEPGPDQQPKSSSSTRTHDPNHQRNDGNRPSQRKGFSIMYVFAPGKSDGWLDLESNRPAVNLEHPLYTKYEPHVVARNYHVAKTVITILVKYGATKKSLSVDEAFELQTKLLTKLRDSLF